MAEQAQKQAEVKQEPRPQVRLVKLAGEVFLPDAQTLGGTAGRLEIDLEGRTAAAHKASATLERLGVCVRYTGSRGKELVTRAALVPWHMVTRVDVAPEWKP
jgi:hypothetical protein